MNLFEIAQKAEKNGYKKFKLVLAEIYPDDCVVNEAGTLYNDNGITWLKKYCEQNIGSIKDTTLAVDFLDDEKTEATGHGATGIIKDGIPILSAECVGHFNNGYIVEENEKTLLVGEGYLDYMRYHDFIDNLIEKLKNGETIYGSVEFISKKGNKEIQYLYGYKDLGRIPTEFEFSGYAILGCGVEPADKSAALLELSSKKESEEEKMDEKTIALITDSVKNTIIETNSNNKKLEDKISELNEIVVGKDNKIAELNKEIETVNKALEDLKKEQDTYWEERSALEKELGELKAKARIDKLNKELEPFTEDEQKCAEKEINEFKADPMKCEIEINSIVEKIYAEMGKKSKEQANKNHIAEQNSKTECNIFGDVDDVTPSETKFNIFD